MSAQLNTLKQYLWDSLPGDSQRYVQLLWNRDAGKFVGCKEPYEKNNMEKVSDWMLGPAVDLTTYPLFKNRYFQVAAGASALTFIFLKFIEHPVFTTTQVGHLISLLPRACKYLAGLTIAGFVGRCFGRMFNTDLMRQFYNLEAK